jgi:hypothetical protein
MDLIESMNAACRPHGSVIGPADLYETSLPLCRAPGMPLTDTESLTCFPMAASVVPASPASHADGCIDFSFPRAAFLVVEISAVYPASPQDRLIITTIDGQYVVVDACIPGHAHPFPHPILVPGPDARVRYLAAAAGNGGGGDWRLAVRVAAFAHPASKQLRMSPFSATFESAHPYDCSKPLVEKVRPPNAAALLVTFDAQCALASGDSVSLICPAQHWYFGGPEGQWPVAPVLVPSAGADIVFVPSSSSASSREPAWGFRLTVSSLEWGSPSPKDPEENSHRAALSEYDALVGVLDTMRSLACLLGKRAAVSMARLPPAAGSAPPAAHAWVAMHPLLTANGLGADTTGLEDLRALAVSLTEKITGNSRQPDVVLPYSTEPLMALLPDLFLVMGYHLNLADELRLAQHADPLSTSMTKKCVAAAANILRVC